MTIGVHEFYSSGEAYDASQCREDIKNGDILIVHREKVIGILIDAWPTAITILHGAFHTLAEGRTWDTVRSMSNKDGSYPPFTPKWDEVTGRQTEPLPKGDRDYIESAKLAYGLAKQLHYPYKEQEEPKE